MRVLCSRGRYGGGGGLASGPMDGVDIRRLPWSGISGSSVVGRALNDGLFLIQASACAVLNRARADVVLAATSPPFIGLAAALAGRARTLPHAHWTMDVYPDVIQAHRALMPESWVARALDAVARFQFGRAALVLTLGPFMAGRVARHLDARVPLHAVPLWGDLDEDSVAPGAVRDMRLRRGWGLHDFVLMYSGNMGRGHRFREFVEAARRLGPEGPRWAFIGDGARRNEVAQLARQYPAARIELLPPVASSDVAASLLSADVQLVSLSSAWQALIVPSKLQAAFAVGRPVILVGPPDNEAAAWIRESGGGWVVGEDNVEGLMRAIEEARDDHERSRRGRAARAFARAHFDRQSNCTRIADLLETCVAPPGGSAERHSFAAGGNDQR